MKEKLSFLYGMPGKLNPSEATFDWFQKEPYGLKDLQEELSSANIEQLFKIILGIFLEDELNLSMFLKCMGNFSVVREGIYYSKSSINSRIKEIRVTTSMSPFERIETILLNFTSSPNDLFQLEDNQQVDIWLNSEVVFGTKELSSSCRALFSYNRSTQNNQTTVLLVYQRILV